MKLTDYIIHFLAEKGVSHAFGLTGGAVVHLFDSAFRTGRIKPIFHHHEQAASFAAEAYARASNNFGVCFITTGPGVTNALTGLAAAWLDSLPCLYISGQSRLSQTTRNRKIRQGGSQQMDIIPLVQPMTKYAVMIEDPNTIRYHLEKAFELATTERPGPVWIDLPLDIQWAQIEPDKLIGFEGKGLTERHPVMPNDLATCLAWLEKSERPLILAGAGIRLAKAETLFLDFIRRHKIPFVTSWGAADIIPSTDSQNIGRIGVSGQRGANLAVQNCDLLICIGSHLCLPLTGSGVNAFAREAKKVVVDIDRTELDEINIPIDLSIQADAGDFLRTSITSWPSQIFTGSDRWIKGCIRFKLYNLSPALTRDSNEITSYQVVKVVSDLSEEGDTLVVDGGGTNVYVSFQTIQVKERQRLILSTGLCAMGSGIPESIGACYARGLSRTICFCGDGSFQLNVQELQTLKYHCLPIKVFVINNGGYLSIRHTQRDFLDSNYVGSKAEGGMSLPEICKVSEAYGIPAVRIERKEELVSRIREVLDTKGPVVCEVCCCQDQDVEPRAGFDKRSNGTFTQRPLEDMMPYLDREELSQNMFIKPWNKLDR